MRRVELARPQHDGAQDLLPRDAARRRHLLHLLVHEPDCDVPHARLVHRRADVAAVQAHELAHGAVRVAALAVPALDGVADDVELLEGGLLAAVRLDALRDALVDVRRQALRALDLHVFDGRVALLRELEVHLHEFGLAALGHGRHLQPRPISCNPPLRHVCVSRLEASRSARAVPADAQRCCSARLTRWSVHSGVP